eukprot:1693691-Amphidinium_carterae.1
MQLSHLIPGATYTEGTGALQPLVEDSPASGLNYLAPPEQVDRGDLPKLTVMLRAALELARSESNNTFDFLDRAWSFLGDQSALQRALVALNERLQLQLSISPATLKWFSECKEEPLQLSLLALKRDHLSLAATDLLRL